MNKKYNYLYKITNLINGNFYYGIHSTNNLDDGYMGSGKCLLEAYEKYGIENFKKDIIEFKNNREELSKLEKEVVNEELINDPNCYNIRMGGEDGWTSMCFYKIHEVFKKIQHQQKEKNSQFGTCWITKDEENRKIKKDELETYLNNGWERGRKVSDEFRDKCKQNSIDTCFVTNGEKILKIKNTDLQKYIEDGWIKAGNKYTFNLNVDDIKEDLDLGLTYDEIIKKHNYNISYRSFFKYLKDNNIFNTYNFRRGEKNPQFNKKWIHKDNVSKTVSSESVQLYLRDGWELGKK